MAGKAQRKPLPLKEQTLFKELLSQYENRTLKRALKTADQILKKIPDHGETLCMKGLVLSHMNRKDEGLELVKKGLVFDMQSHICWHVLGIIKKADKNWDEALKAYSQAVRCDKENMNLLRDTAQLQVHLGLYDNLKETRWLILKLRPNLRQNWVAYVVACQLSGNLSEAKTVLQAYLGTLKNVPSHDVEHSEVLLYYIRILEDLHEFSFALEQLDFYAKERAIVDKTAIAEHRARLLSKSGRIDEASQAWRSLVDQNSEFCEYYRQLFALKSIDLDNVSDDNRSEAMRYLDELMFELPRSTTPRRLALGLSTGSFEEFNPMIRAYLIDGFVRGVPSLFVDIRPLYVNEQKRKIIEDIVMELREKIENGVSIDDNPNFSADPTVYLWILYFLALHHCTRPLSPGAPPPDPLRSLRLIELAIAHTPTLPELYMGKARILKRAGDPFGAARAMEEARRLDGQDRFLNWKAARYRMRAGDIEGGIQLLGLFTKKDAPNPGSDLIDMQCLTYMLEEGNSHIRNGNIGLALRSFKAVQDTFTDIEDDQFDFHNYSLRRFSLNVYLNLLSFEKQLRSHPAYIEAALASSKIYIRLYDDPTLVSSFTGGKPSEADKKAKKKAKKAAQKVIDDIKKPLNVAEDIPETPKDEDLDGKKLLTTSDPLGDAMRWLKPLELFAKDRIDVWIVIYDVSVRRKHFLQALKALNQARYLNSRHPDVFVRTIDYRLRVALIAPDVPEPIDTLIKTSVKTLDDPSKAHVIDEFLQENPNSAEALLAAGRVAQLLGKPMERVENFVFGMLDPNVNVNVKISLDALDWLRDIKSPRAEEFRETALRIFPLSTVFKPADELISLRDVLCKTKGEDDSNGIEHVNTI